MCATSVSVAPSVVPVRILVVDAFEPWRHALRSMLKEHAELQVVGEVADGLEAAQEARELKPDLILLDISLPHLNGIEAAKRIHQVVPQAAILYLTLNNNEDVIRAALSNGAKGYVLKSDAGSQLCHAIEAIVQGSRFVSSSVARFETDSN